jgi:hypothetical protein
MNACHSLLVKPLIEGVVTEGTFAGRSKYRARRNSVPSIAVTVAVPGYGDGFIGPSEVQRSHQFPHQKNCLKVLCVQQKVMIKAYDLTSHNL